MTYTNAKIPTSKLPGQEKKENVIFGKRSYECK